MATLKTLVATILAISTLAGCVSPVRPAQPQTAAPQPQQPGTSPQAASAAPAQVKLLKTQPEKGFGGEKFTMNAEGLPANKEVAFVWVTFEGTYDAKANPDILEFYEPKFVEKRVTLGRASTDAQGRIQVSFTAPEDFGETHDIYGLIDGQQVAKGGFRILRRVTLEPAEGPVGTPITLKVTGLGWKPVERNMAVRYDNQYTGFVSGITTHGTATAVLRAAGPVGVHTIEMSGTGGNGGGYLNNQQSPYAHIFPATGSFRVLFRVTRDAGLPADISDGPEASRIAQLGDGDGFTTRLSEVKTSGPTLSLDRTSGPVLSKVNLRATNLPASTEYELAWGTVLGHLLNTPGWDREPTRNLGQISLGKASSGKDGSLTTSIEVPDELGGWHAIRLVKDGTTIAQTRFFVERSLVSVSSKRVKVGETVTIEIKGVGWTDVDNGYAITYDNAYIGYACGFNSRGSIILNLPAARTPGTHLIDLYPMTYLRTGKPGWVYMMPQLTYAQDHPGLQFGYKSSALRLAIEVVE